jgi:CCR4-NOT transcriptional complex subunit CAF120
MQDKQDRSAKRQEELARETGASLINVPNKPPPPQTGLLGAITAHERERKREGGVGAALTEREREKRMAEDRQRKIDDFQRNQLEMQGMYGGGQQFPNMNPNMMGNPMMANPMMMGMNPMMAGGNPMMTGANPMMTGGYMGYPSMMPGFGNPQFFAQQAAQAAYQQAMMAYSTAGSHVGDGMHPMPMNPMMTGGGMGYDPRMSMMGVPMMGNPMGMNHMGGGMEAWGAWEAWGCR